MHNVWRITAFIILIACIAYASHRVTVTSNNTGWNNAVQNYSITFTITRNSTGFLDNITGINITNMSANVMFFAATTNDSVNWACTNTTGVLSCINRTTDGNLSGNEVLNLIFNITANSDGNLTIALNTSDDKGQINGTTINLAFDITPPTMTFLSPVAAANLSGTVTVNVSITDTTSNISAVRFRNGTSGSQIVMSLYAGTTSNGNWSGTFASSSNADGSLLLMINASNFAGLFNLTVNRSVTIDNSPPTVSIMSPVLNANLSGTVTVNISVADLQSNVTNVSVKNGTGGNTIFATRYGGTQTDGNWSITFNSAQNTDGSLLIMVNASSFSGVTNLTVNRTITVDNSPPTVSFLLPAPAANLSGTTTVNVSVADSVSNVSSVTFKNGTSGNYISMTLYAGTQANGNWSVSWNTASNADGSVLLMINGTNFAGVSNLTVNRSVTADNSVPIVSSYFLPVNESNVSGVIIINMSASDTFSNISTVQFRLEKDVNYTPWTSLTMHAGNIALGNWSGTFNTSTISDSIYNVTLNLTDFAGNGHPQNSSNRKQITILNSPPTISSLSPSGSLSSASVTLSLTTNLPTNCTYDNTGGSYPLANNFTDQGSTSHSQSLSLSSGSSYTFYVICVNVVGVNSSSASTTFTITSGDGGISGGGGGSGGYSAPNTNQIQKTAAIVSSIESVATVPIVGSNIAVDEIKIEVNSPATNVVIDVKSLVAQPAGASVPSGKIFQYLDISAVGLDNNLKSVEISFSVPKAWITENGADLGALKLLHWTGINWETLSTEQTGSSDTDYKFTAKSKGLSPYAIAFITAAPSQPGQTQQPDGSSSGQPKQPIPAIYWLLGIMALIILFAISYKYRKKRYPLHGR